MDPSLLKKVGLFEGLTQSQLEKVAGLAQARSYEGSSYIFREGEAGDGMFVLLSGKVRISKQVPGMGEEALAILEPGHCFGEMALIDGAPRSADAIAHTACSLWLLERSRMDELMFTDKELAYVVLWTFVRTLSERLRDTTGKLQAVYTLSRF